MVKGLVSIIIPVIRKDPNLAECLEAIKCSSYRNYEIIVVDEGLERSAQRNIGMDRAKGEFFLVLDSDMMITPFMLADCVKKIKGHQAVYIPERIVTKGWFGRLRDWERQFYNGTLVDVVRFIRAEGCPRFDEELHGVEDSDWERRIHGKKAICDYPFHHHDKVTIKRYFQKKAYYAQSLGKYKKKNPDDKLLTFRYRCVKVFIENGKWKRFISRPHLALGVILLIFARGVIAVCAKKS
jgi:glycosyltransferase involved in cell wall biosynthesis